MSSDDHYDPSDPLKGADRCPVCHNRGRVVSDDEYRFVCGLCGAPRVKTKGTELTLSGQEAAPLRLAQKARAIRARWRIAGAFGGAIGGLTLATTALMWLIFSTGIAFNATALLLALPFVLLAAAAFAKNKSLGTEVAHHVDEAWKSAVRDAVRAIGGEVTAPMVSELLPISETGADEMLAELSVEVQLRSRITSEGRLAYESDTAGAPAATAASTQVRVDVGVNAAGKTQVADEGEEELEARFEALEEALAAEDAANAEKTAKR
jgi:hypothetical protein